METEELARITQEQFSAVDGQLHAIREEMNQRFSTVEQKMDRQFTELKDGQKAMMAVLVDVPSKKHVERLSDKLDNVDTRVVALERKVRTA